MWNRHKNVEQDGCMKKSLVINHFNSCTVFGNGLPRPLAPRIARISAT